MATADIEHYRNNLTAALVRIEQLEHELLLFRSDPAHERVDIAEEQLARAWRRRVRARKLLPRVLIGSFVAMGAFALTDPSLPVALRVLGLGLCGLGAVSTVMTIIALLVVQRPRTAKLEELERRVRIAKGDVGARLLVAAPPSEEEREQEEEPVAVRRLA